MENNSKEEMQKLAEEHYIYTEGIIKRLIVSNSQLGLELDEKTLELCKYLYIEAFKHGYKHGQEDSA